ncbi:MAG: hypothetical protein A2788_00730 [Candidatus Abawacabacteria bacterium RIFCSPHIGHO2_01_FULL_46_8]|uniref:Type II secretion system protein GspF domain-containing protein n=1 Tax=Candidatus Abawacabacteria bacterium RIFCSPHIGHO2_01_FULL_46_8 TaxID=1817815 RepID=A0A1F4XHD4_9BACT|nr:MAG: hypothetical protein A2788_00730 [Candidatus Abawacabacteria bacterium RIFCSPHIGHO2_01_FULL_46_8]
MAEAGLQQIEQEELKQLLQVISERLLLARQREMMQRERQIAAYLEAVKRFQAKVQSKLGKVLGDLTKKGKLEILEFKVGVKQPVTMAPATAAAAAAAALEEEETAPSRKPTSTEQAGKEVVLIITDEQKGFFERLQQRIKVFFSRLRGKKTVASGLAALPLRRPQLAAPFDFRKVKESIEVTKDKVRVRTTKKTGNFLLDAISEVNEWLADLTPIRTRDLVTFYQLLAVMVNAGIPLLKSLQQLVPQTKNVRLRKVMVRLVYEIENGASLSDSMDLYPGVFDDSQRGMVRAGEASGSLTGILQRLAESMEKTDNIVSKIRGAMMYPAFVMIVLLVVSIILLVEVIPKLSELFMGAGVDMPASTRLLLAASDLFRNYYLLIFLGVVGFIALISFILKTSWGRYYWHWLKLKLPIVGKMSRMVALSKFTRGLGTLSASGISIVKNLRINADAIGNELYRRELLYTVESVKRGVSIADDLRQSPLFPSMMVNMIAIGEETAKIDEVSLKIADYYDQEIDTMVKGMSSVMEPLIIVVIGLMVALVVTAVMEPILKLSEVADVI